MKNKNVWNVLILWSVMRVKTDEKPTGEKSFASIQGTRLRFDVYFVKSFEWL